MCCGIQVWLIVWLVVVVDDFVQMGVCVVVVYLEEFFVWIVSCVGYVEEWVG